MSDTAEAISQVITVTTKTTLPAPVTLTGTITSSGLAITGTGTLFLTELCFLEQTNLKVKYLWDSTNTEMREIATVVDDTHLTLKVAFSNVISGQALKVPDPAIQYREISLAPAGAGCKVCTANKATVTMNPDVMMEFGNDGGLQPPLALDGTASAIQVSYQ